MNVLQENIQRIIDNRRLNITEANFVNPASKFIIITYWWGRGNLNRNTQSPCKDLAYVGYNWVLKDGQKLLKEPETFEGMIDKWNNNCISKNCNYFSQEYPEFAVAGGYQLAINAKPLFIKKVLETLRDMGKGDISVVYIDGDMTVNKYPHIFDMKNVDYMGRGWNIDPRSNVHYKTKPCFDPFTFETSGGIMYFGNNDNGHALLTMWNKWSFMQKFQGKADDRILSMLINSKQLYITMNVLQLPIEYLWLTDAYEPLDKRDAYLDKKHVSRKEIVFEHPACLTTEEAARDQGAAANRQPAYYDVLVENLIDCQTEGGVLHEYIVFDKLAQAKEWKKYLQYISSADASLGNYKDGEPIIPYYIRNYKSGYANKHDFVEGNTEAIRTIISYLKQSPSIGKYDLVYVLHDGGSSEIDGDMVYVKTGKEVILYIIALLAMNKDVVYLPKKLNGSASNRSKSGTGSKSGSGSKSLKYILKNKDKYELICNINNDSLNYPIIDENAPMYFSHLSERLMKLLRMSEDIPEFNKNLKMCALYIQLIRCYFIMDLKKLGNTTTASGASGTAARRQVSRVKSYSAPKRPLSKSNRDIFKYKSI
jgi:hypothetical protein|uniref:Nucleotide-diphospho-sugar transferase domain-containing protein n=1 Tax=viral metagenome TaxID=1070528 RepID=A0A6C0CCD3_9ZZZZ